MPNFNYGKFLNKSINSVLKQTFDDWKLIIIDDGSTDNSHKLLKRYEKYQKIKIIKQKNKGLNITNNIALRLSDSDYIVRLDPDDYLDENFLNISVNFLEKNKNIGLVYPDYFTVDDKNNIISLVRYPDNNFENSLNDLPPHGACTVFRRSILTALGGYDETVTRQDGFDIWLKFIKKHKPHNIKIPLFYYRRHQKNITNDKRKILEAKSKIIKNHTKNLNTKKKILCIIPVSSSSIYDFNSPLIDLCGKPLIWYTLNAASKCKNINEIIVNTKNKDVIKYVKNNFKKIKIVIRKKSYENSLDKEIILDTIKLKAKYKEYDFTALLYISTPLRRYDHIDTSISMSSIFNTDLLISVTEELSQLYSHDKKGLKKINNITNTIRLERDSIYKDNGSIYVYKNKSLNKKSSSLSVGHIQMLPEESIKINSNHEYKLAEFLLKNNEK